MVTLPDELLYQICGYLAPHDVHRDVWKPIALAKLLRTSRSFRRAAQPVLYHGLDLENVEYAKNTKFRKWGAPLRSFLLSCITDSTTAKFVKEVRLGRWSPRGRDVFEDSGPSEPDVSEVDPAVLTAIENINTSPALRERLRAGIRRDDSHAWVALFLCCCEKLTRLYIESSEDLDETLTGAILWEAGSGPSHTGEAKRPFGCLQEIHMEHPDTECSTSMFTQVSFLRLPSLILFHGHMLDWTGQGRLSGFDFTSNVQKIELGQSLIEPVGLDRMLALCPSVRDLRIEWGSATVGDCELDFDELGNVLRRRGTQLQVLRLDAYDLEFDEDEPPGKLGRLDGMRILEELDISWGILFATEEWPTPTAASPRHLVEVLPKSIRKLKIGWATRDHMAMLGDTATLDTQIDALLASDLFPNLCSIVVHMRNTKFGLSLPPGWSCSIAKDLPVHQCWMELKKA